VLNAENALAQAKAGELQAIALRDQAVRRLNVLGLRPGDSPTLVVRAPRGGKVLELTITPGEYRNDLSQPVVTITDLRTVWVTANVPESYIRFIHPGEPIEIALVAFPNEKFAGRVSLIGSTVDPQTRTIRVEAEIDNAGGRLRPEMYGTTHLVEGRRPTAVVPAAALVEAEGRYHVFVVMDDARFMTRDVTIGRPAGALVPVIGLTPGERVVVDGTMLLKSFATAGGKG
jgi:cobalt-zinc-cadmium efflux system membrane fusion protein